MDPTIQLTGIVRASKDAAQRDGATDELLNLRFKNGSLRPVGTPEDFPGFSSLAGTYLRLFIHTNSYRHLFGLTPDGILQWVANIVDGTITPLPAPRDLLAGIDTDDLDSLSLTQTGHIIVVNNHGLSYFIYREADDCYEHIVSDFNTLTDRGLMPFGSIDFRVDEITDPLGYPVWFSTAIESSGIKGAYDNNATGELPPDWEPNETEEKRGYQSKRSTTYQDEEEVLRDVMGKLNKDTDALNLFTRPFLVVTAAELFDGNYILMTEPKLMNAPAMDGLDRTPRHYFDPDGGILLADDEHPVREHSVMDIDSKTASLYAHRCVDQSLASHIIVKHGNGHLGNATGANKQDFTLYDLLPNLYDIAYGCRASRWNQPAPALWYKSPGFSFEHFDSSPLNGANTGRRQNYVFPFDRDDIQDHLFRAAAYANDALLTHAGINRSLDTGTVPAY